MLPPCACGHIPHWWLTFVRTGLSSLFVPASLGALIIIFEFPDLLYPAGGITPV
jgi:hypothetical protein